MFKKAFDMNKFGIEVSIKNVPELDEEFFPIFRFNEEFLKDAKKPVGLALERSGGEMGVSHSFIHGTSSMKDADCFYIERLLKTMLWMKGGYRVFVSGDKTIYEYIKKAYSKGGIREFDRDFMGDVYEKPFEVLYVDKLPSQKDSPKAIGGHLEGCRIGFDAGGSDRKVSAVIDGETVYSEEVVWYPKENSNPDYHYEEILSALKSAASYMPKVDAVGVSSAGIYINNRTMRASLFIKVPEDLFEKKVKDIYIRAIRDTFGNIPFAVINDGDVSALAGAMSLNENNVLGIAMGTSEAGGFVDETGCITGWLNELAFVPVDVNECAMLDEWSGDKGCGVKYFSQDSVIKLAQKAGITFNKDSSPAQKLHKVQKLIGENDPMAKAVYRSIGVYLGHTLSFYYSLYQFKHVLLLGRVMSGMGGDIILEKARQVLKEEYPKLLNYFDVGLPDEKYRKLGQSMAAASLPEV